MPKIVKAYEITRESDLSLLRSFTAQELDEAGLLGNIASKLGTAVGKAKDTIKKTAGGMVKDFQAAHDAANPKAAKDQEHAADQSSADDQEGDSPNTRHLVQTMLTVPSGFDRIVLGLSDGDLKTHYLKQGGGATLVDQFADADVLALASSGVSHTVGGAIFSNLKQDGKLSALIGAVGSSQAAVLLNVPASLITAIKTAGTDAARAKEELKKMMDHKFYKMTLSMGRVKKISSADQTTINSGDADAAIDVFDPNVILNFPDRNTITSAKEEWTEKKSAADPENQEEKQVTADEKKANRVSRQREAQKTIVGGPSNIQMDILNIATINATESANDVAKRLATRFGPAATTPVPHADVVSAVNSLATALGGKMSQILAELQTAVSW